MLRGHGMVKTSDMKPWEYEMRDLGFNYRITDIQCALGLSQLKRLDGFIARRIEIVKNYDDAFDYYNKGNRAKRARFDYNEQASEKFIENIKDNFSKDYFKKWGWD